RDSLRPGPAHPMVSIITVNESLTRASGFGFRLAGYNGASGGTEFRLARYNGCFRNRAAALGRALQRRLGVEAAQEYFQRQRRDLEVASQELQVGPGLPEPGDRQVDPAQRFLDVATQGRLQRPRQAFPAPGLPQLACQVLE